MQSTFYFACVLALLLYATLRGSAPERTIVWTILLADLADTFYHRIHGPSDFRFIDYTHVVIDSLAFIAVLWTALGSNRFWPLPVCSLHLLGLTGHAAVFLGIQGLNQVYWAMVTVTDYIQLPIIALGLAMHDRRVRRIGRYRDWRRNWRVPSLLTRMA